MATILEIVILIIVGILGLFSGILLALCLFDKCEKCNKREKKK